MHRSDRLLGILLQLDDQQVTPASALAGHFEVSLRTIYRDMDALSELGIPFYARAGRNGGFQLVEGYKLPPIMFTEGESISLILAIALLGSLRSRPYATDLDRAESKLLQALPSPLQQTLRRARRIIGFEGTARTAFHIEHGEHDIPVASPEGENRVLETYLGAILAGQVVEIRYRSPYRPDGPRRYRARPTGIFWDRDCWYLAGVLEDGEQRIWRADRVQSIDAEESNWPALPVPDLSAYLNRAWLASAMRDWATHHPVRIRITPEQAERLQGDWYYRHAIYDELPDGQIMLTFGQDRPEIVRELVRWLGPDAELVEPAAWRELIQDDLRQMLRVYDDPPG